ncbi:NADP-dependent oxidoreductase [Saccharothrix variisporea]|uniref:NADPH:quinone reductase-like Zn-dependent oxidoreductase n=1 Tax=Saccharothrix variisporea TaxID=543527 RepID=A0A495X393_9PSEU|nr:NADP-dependent oxidoreductase [Saccharothrix variisporea]RKT67063.1 NADPH:quinone reductase-like Zn-dependent oxidoreductase [Saccharothrix variisporea]
MRALHIPAAGEPARLGHLPKPHVTPGTVLVRVHAASLNGIDNGTTTGTLARFVPHEYPVVIGRDGAGVVESVGAGVDHVRPGDEVFGHIQVVPPIHHGTLAEHALFPAVGVVGKPAALDFAEAAALPLAGTAALEAVEHIAAEPGRTVLVNGASGGVGSFVLQLLASRGATVLATGAADDTGRLTGLGAREVVDRAHVLETVRATHPDGVDALINLSGHTVGETPLAAVRRGGVVATTTGAPDRDAASEVGVTHHMVVAEPSRDVLARLAEMAVTGALKVDIGAVLPLERAWEGLEVLASGRSRGKIVITLD